MLQTNLCIYGSRDMWRPRAVASSLKIYRLAGAFNCCPRHEPAPETIAIPKCMLKFPLHVAVSDAFDNSQLMSWPLRCMLQVHWQLQVPSCICEFPNCMLRFLWIFMFIIDHLLIPIMAIGGSHPSRSSHIPTKSQIIPEHLPISQLLVPST